VANFNWSQNVSVAGCVNPAGPLAPIGALISGAPGGFRLAA
jgi:hypothetical protein